MSSLKTSKLNANKFKVGDKVKVVKQQDGLEDYQIPIGSVGEVLEVDGSDTVGLAYFVKSSSFRGGYGINKDTWWFEEDNLELLSNEGRDVGVIKTMYNPLIAQEGGGHYKNRGIQPLEYTMQNNLSFCEGNVVKYISRYKSKNGIEDLAKVIHYALLASYEEYGEQGSTELKEKVLKLLGENKESEE